MNISNRLVDLARKLALGVQRVNIAVKCTNSQHQQLWEYKLELLPSYHHPHPLHPTQKSKLVNEMEKSGRWLILPTDIGCVGRTCRHFPNGHSKHQLSQGTQSQYDCGTSGPQQAGSSLGVKSCLAIQLYCSYSHSAGCQIVPPIHQRILTSRWKANT